MDEVANPYSPGAGMRPAALVGREDEQRRWDIALRRLQAARNARSVVLYGLRGVGKTVLLTDFARTAAAHGWIAVRAEAGAGKTLRELLGEGMHPFLADLARPNAGARIRKALKTALSFKASYDTSGVWNFGIDLSEQPGGGADTGVLETDIAKITMDVSAAADNGLAILIDEAQDLRKEELAVIAATVHRANQDGWPLLVALAGLPSLPGLLAQAKSYSERLWTFERIDTLDAERTQAAIVEPARDEGVLWEPAAVAEVVRESSGYPYFIQQFGQQAWNAATSSPIGLTEARIGIATGLQLLDNGFFRTRWDRASVAERAFLRAMAADGDASCEISAVAKRLAKKTTTLGPVRASLIRKGLIFAPEHGVVAFTVPHMPAFISRQTP